MFILYDLIFLLISIFYLPIYLFKRKFHAGFLLRLGFLPKDLRLNRPIWIHAVSVGEAMTIKSLVGELRKAYPDKKMVISTVTPTGNKIARGIAREGDFITYLPLDFSFIVKRVIGRINPEILILMETELWPNLIRYLKQKDIPCIVLNGRISDASFKGYRMIRLLIGPLLNKVNFFCVQTESDAQRLIFLGAPADNVGVTGNMKFDVMDAGDFKKDQADYKRKLSLQPKDKFFVAGSTHPGEEEMIFEVYEKLLGRFADLKLLIAPRHPDRAQDIANLANSHGFNPIRVSGLTGERVSGLNPHTRTPAHPYTVFILDTVGELVSYYTIADIVFVGGSLVDKGGHNILEPARAGKPVLFGPHMSNFRDMAHLFVENKAGISVRDKEELEKKIIDLLVYPDKINEMTGNATALIRRNQGTTKRNLERIMRITYGN